MACTTRPAAYTPIKEQFAILTKAFLFSGAAVSSSPCPALEAKAFYGPPFSKSLNHTGLAGGLIRPYRA